MDRLLQIFSTLLLALVLALIVSADHNVPKVNIHQEKKNSKRLFNPADYRLPKSIVPDSYNLKITNIDFNKFMYNGITTIKAHVKESVEEIVLNAGSISVIVNSIHENGKNIEVVKTNHNKTTQIFRIILSKILTDVSTLEISLSFGGKLRDDMLGFYKSSYYNDEGEQRWLAATKFSNANARHAFPCFDEPEFKAEFDIEIQVPEGYGCLSNMKLTLDKTKNYCHFEKSVKMSTYLVAFVISDFKPDPNNDTSLKLWARPNAKTQTAYGQSIAAKAIKTFSELFDQDYYETMKKMDMVALPDFKSYALEDWGLILYRETAALYDANHLSDAAQQRVASVIVHECSHMWLGNLVTPQWWRYLWLSEAFARYFEYMATDMVTENWKMSQQFIVDQFRKGLAADSFEHSRPMTRPEGAIVTSQQISSAGGLTTYAKGASIVRMMEKTFGTDAFYNALRKYIKTKKFKSVTPDDLWQALQEFVDPKIDVATVMRTWTEQAGYPYITVKVETDSIKIRQDRLVLHSKNKKTTQSLWWVPITISSSNIPTNSTKPVFWLSEREGEIMRDNKKDDWIILNVQSAGFYRVNYDNDSWERIVHYLKSGDLNKINVKNRAAIVDDLLNFARAELIDYKLVFRALEYLKRETHYLPFKSALVGLDYLTRATAGSFANKILKRYALSLIRNVHKKLTFSDKPGDDRLTILLRQELNSALCSYNDPLCISKSQKYFNSWRTNNRWVPKNQRSIVYCTAVKYGMTEDWNFLYKHHRETNVAAEQVNTLKALGCSQNTTILESYLKEALSGYKNSRIHIQEVSGVFKGVYKASINNAEFIIDFVNKNHQAFHDFYSGYDEIVNIITRALRRYPIKKLVHKVEKILESNTPHIAANAASIQKAVKFVKQEIDLFNKQLLPVIDLIK